MPKASKKSSQSVKSKKVSAPSVIKNVKGKVKVSSGKKIKTIIPCYFSYILIIFIGLFAVSIMLLFYFQNINLWNNNFQIKEKSVSVSQQVAPLSLANPASEFCINNGGQWKTWNNVVGERGICYFSESRQCEEWAMYRGDCPVGGVDLSAHLNNKANQYCLMIGGNIIDKEDCFLPNGVVCNILELYQGICQP